MSKETQLLCILCPVISWFSNNTNPIYRISLVPHLNNNIWSCIVNKSEEWVWCNMPSSFGNLFPSLDRRKFGQIVSRYLIFFFPLPPHFKAFERGHQIGESTKGTCCFYFTFYSKYCKLWYIVIRVPAQTTNFHIFTIPFQWEYRYISFIINALPMRSNAHICVPFRRILLMYMMTLHLHFLSSNGKAPLKLLDELLRNYDRRSTPTNHLGKWIIQPLL